MAETNVADVIAAQQRAIAEQIAEAQRRDRATFGPAAADAAPPAPVMGGALGQAIAQGQVGQPVASPPPAPPPQPQIPIPPPSTMQQQQAQSQEQRRPALAQQIPKEPDLAIVRWYPGRNSPNRIELTDSLITNLPDSIEQESDGAAKVSAALLSEILSLRARVFELENAADQQPPSADMTADLAQRVYRLEATLFEQRDHLRNDAKSFREEVQRKAAQELEESKNKEE